MKKSIPPENDMQDLWQLSGRVEAMIAYIKAESYIVDKNIILKMLGHGDEYLPIQQDVLRVVPTEKEGTL